MTIIEASSVSIKTMADGTLRIAVDVEPRHAQAAFSLFGGPGTPMALAALKPASSKPEASTTPGVGQEVKGGPLSQWAALRCKEPEFDAWLAETFPSAWRRNGEDTASTLRGVLSIESRAELDNDEAAAERFHRVIRGPYAKHMASRGLR